MICGLVEQPCRRYSQYTRNALIGGEQAVIQLSLLWQNYEEWITEDSQVLRHSKMT